MPEVVELTLEERVGPNLIIERYATRSDTGDGFLGCPALNKDVKSRSSHLTGGSIFTAQ